MGSLRENFNKKLINSINCTHCFKAIVIKKVDADCPYCDRRYYGSFKGDRNLSVLLFDKCVQCSNTIKYINCPNCGEIITLDESLPDNGILVCKINRSLSLVEAVKADLDENPDILKHPVTQFIFGFIGEKAVKVLENIFHKIDLTNEKNALEKMELAHKGGLLKIDLLMKLAEFNFKKAEGDTAIEKAGLLKKGVESFDKLTPILKAYVISCLLGHSNQSPNDLAYDDEIRNIIKNMKEEDLKRTKIENDHIQWKYDENRKRQ